MPFTFLWIWKFHCSFRLGVISSHNLFNTPLTFNCLLISFCTTRFNIQKFYMVFTLRLYVLYGPYSKMRNMPYTALQDCFCVTEVKSVYCVVRTVSLYKIDTFTLWRVIVVYFKYLVAYMIFIRRIVIVINFLFSICRWSF